MFNLIPAILLLLAGGPFGPSSGDAIARIESMAPKARVVHLARELERAGLTAAQAVLVMASCEDEPSQGQPVLRETASQRLSQSARTESGHGRSSRTRDGPTL